MTRQEFLEGLSRDLVDRGKLIEAGWVSMRILVVPADAPQAQLDEMRMAFFAGAQHLFGSIMTMLDPGEEPTDDDLRRMDAIDAELKDFIKTFEMRAIRTEGSA